VLENVRRAYRTSISQSDRKDLTRRFPSAWPFRKPDPMVSLSPCREGVILWFSPNPHPPHLRIKPVDKPGPTSTYYGNFRSQGRFMDEIYFPPRRTRSHEQPLENAAPLNRQRRTRRPRRKPSPTPRCSRPCKPSKRRDLCATRPRDAPYRYFPGGGRREGRWQRAGARIREAIYHGSSERMFAQLVSDKKLGPQRTRTHAGRYSPNA